MSLFDTRRYLDVDSTSFERYGRQSDGRQNNVVCLLAGHVKSHFELSRTLFDC